MGRVEPFRRVGFLKEDLARDDHYRDAVLLDGGAHGHLEDARRHLGSAHKLGVDAALAKQLLRVRLLEVLGADLRARNVRRDRQHGDAAALRIEQTVDQMQVAGPATARADRQLTRKGRIRGGRERRGLLVTDVLPRDFAGSAYRVGEPVEAVARQAVDATNPTDAQGGDDVIGDGRHPATIAISARLRALSTG